jgi:hypothetical protein
VHKSNHHAIRMALHKYPDGLTISEIAERIEKPLSSIWRALKEMPDAYVDRWVAHRKQWTAVWCAIVPPENCPKPTRLPERKDERLTKFCSLE